MTDRDHIKSLYQLIDLIRDNHERSEINANRQIEELKNKKTSLLAIMNRLKIQQNIFESYDAFITDALEEDPSGNTIDVKTLIGAYKEWIRFNPCTKMLTKVQLTALMQLSPITNKRIKSSQDYAPTLDL
jgi:hypothetical protein